MPKRRRSSSGTSRAGTTPIVVTPRSDSDHPSTSRRAIWKLLDSPNTNCPRKRGNSTSSPASSASCSTRQRSEITPKRKRNYFATSRAGTIPIVAIPRSDNAHPSTSKRRTERPPDSLNTNCPRNRGNSSCSKPIHHLVALMRGWLVEREVAGPHEADGRDGRFQRHRDDLDRPRVVVVEADLDSSESCRVRAGRKIVGDGEQVVVVVLERELDSDDLGLRFGFAQKSSPPATWCWN